MTRPEQAEVLAACRAQAHSAAAKGDRKRRQHLVEGSFADAANNHVSCAIGSWLNIFSTVAARGVGPRRIAAVKLSG